MTRSLILTGALVGAFISLQSAVAEAPKPGQIDATCESMAKLDPIAVKRHMELFAGPVLGKSPEQWTENDFAIARTTAEKCTGFTTDKGQKLRAEAWVSYLNMTRRSIVPVSEEFARANEVAAQERSRNPWLRECIALLEWRRDRRTWETNAADVIGKNLLAMSRQELADAKAAVATCETGLNMVARARKVSDRAGTLIIDDVVFAIAKAEENLTDIEESKGLKRLEVVDAEGRPVPRSYIGSKAKMMVGIVDRSMQLDRTLSGDDLNDLTAWSEEVIKHDRHGPEVLYANAVKEYVSKQIFGR